MSAPILDVTIVSQFHMPPAEGSHSHLGVCRAAVDVLPAVEQDPALWRRLASMSQEQGFFRQAIYCLNRVLFTDRNDVGAQWDRIVLFATIGEHRKASSCT